MKTRRHVNVNVNEMILQQNRLFVPSLAERKDDITVIAKKILARRAISAGKALEGLSDKAVEMMLGYSWPGNLQELQSVLERSIMLSSGTSKPAVRHNKANSLGT